MVLASSVAALKRTYKTWICNVFQHT